jgi:hypothetical protein
MDKTITICENKRAICEFYVIIGNLYVIILTKITINSLGGKYGYIKEKMGGVRRQKSKACTVDQRGRTFLFSQ